MDVKYPKILHKLHIENINKIALSNNNDNKGYILEMDVKYPKSLHKLHTENINKIALSNNDDKRIISSNKITSYPYGYKGKIA